MRGGNRAKKALLEYFRSQRRWFAKGCTISSTRRDRPDLHLLGGFCGRKGAYAEPPSVAYPRKSDVDASFRRLTERLLLAAPYPAIATHDERLIDHTKVFATSRGIAPDAFEFQMLYGIRRDLQRQIRREGYRMRVYVPFGTFPYFMRRLAERPANLGFVLRSLFLERRSSGG